MEKLGKIISIEEVFNLKLANIGSMNGKNGSQLGMRDMINALWGYGEYDGYKIVTDENEFNILISNGQSCCESWGYFSTNDEPQEFIGKVIEKIVLTDTNLSNKELTEARYLDRGDIQFVTFYIEGGDRLQFAVYNSHNGYYGHTIIIAQNEDILLQDVL